MGYIQKVNLKRKVFMNKLLVLILVSLSLNAQKMSITKGWGLFGAIEDINILSMEFKCVESIYIYRNKKFIIFETDGSKIPFDTLKSGDGFWAYSENNCEEDTNTPHGGELEEEFNLNNYKKTEDLSLDIKKSLAYMGNEEKLAYDVYIKLGAMYPSSRQFINIAKRSEIKHTKMVQDLIQRYNIKGTDLSDDGYIDKKNQYKKILDMDSGVYGVTAVQNLYNLLIAEAKSEVTALKVACKIEVTDINDLNKYINQAKEVSDISTTFDKLRQGSYKHYWAFDRALKSKNETNGCFVKGDNLLTNKNGIYPES
jgi:hypothetical protein